MNQVATQRRPRSDEDRKPDYIARAPDPQRRGKWLSVGAAWARPDGSGFNIKLSVIPVTGWDGALVLLPPIENEPENENQDR